MEPERYRPFNRRGRELELAARPLLVLSGCQRAGNHNNKTKTHLHRFLYTTGGGCGTAVGIGNYEPGARWGLAAGLGQTGAEMFSVNTYSWVIYALTKRHSGLTPIRHGGENGPVGAVFAPRKGSDRRIASARRWAKPGGDPALPWRRLALMVLRDLGSPRSNGMECPARRTGGGAAAPPVCTPPGRIRKFNILAFFFNAPSLLRCAKMAQWQGSAFGHRSD